MSVQTVRQVEDLIDQLSPSEQALLMERLARRVRLTVLSPVLPARDLYGAWKAKFPEDLDLDAALSEIREEWTNEWDQEGNLAE